MFHIFNCLTLLFPTDIEKISVACNYIKQVHFASMNNLLLLTNVDKIPF